MKDQEINDKLEQHDRNLKLYVDMKIRAVKKLLAPFIWMGKHPGWAAIIFVSCISIGIWVSHRITAKQVIEATTGIEIIDDIHE